jgi:hypothetical protein
MTTYSPPLTDGWTSVSDTKPKRSGKLKCGMCGKEVVIGKWTKLAFCPDSGCVNSEEAYMN